MSDIFLSYASADRARVEPLVTALQRLGWSVWWDPTILAGKTWDQVIEKELDEARCVVVVWTRNSIDRRWVRTEAEEGLRRGILVPVLMEEVRIPLAFRSIQAARLVDWSGELQNLQFDHLVRSISTIVPQRAVAHPLKAAAAERVGEAESANPAVTIPPGKKRVNPKDGLTYVWIPPGTFTMGCSEGDKECFTAEKPSHPVTLTRGFWLGQTPVTVGAFAQFRGERPTGDPNLPQVNVSWEDAQAYAKWAQMRYPRKPSGNMRRAREPLHRDTASWTLWHGIRVIAAECPTR